MEQHSIQELIVQPGMELYYPSDERFPLFNHFYKTLAESAANYASQCHTENPRSFYRMQTSVMETAEEQIVTISLFHRLSPAHTARRYLRQVWHNGVLLRAEAHDSASDFLP